MTVASSAIAPTKELVKFTVLLLRQGFNSSKCKMAAKMAVARIKLLRNKREVVVRQMRRDIALLLQSGQDATARISGMPSRFERRSAGGEGRCDMHFEDSVSAAEAAAESAKKAIAATEVAAYLAKKDYDQAIQPSVYDDKLNNPRTNSEFFQSNDPAKSSQNTDHQIKTQERMYRSQTLPMSDYINKEDTAPSCIYDGKDYRSHSYNLNSAAHSNIEFDDSDCDEEIETEESTVRPLRWPPQPSSSSQLKQGIVSLVHPKLPDYDELASRFEALKLRKSQS